MESLLPFSGPVFPAESESRERSLGENLLRNSVMCRRRSILRSSRQRPSRAADCSGMRGGRSKRRDYHLGWLQGDRRTRTRLENQIVDARGAMRIIGPNCVGVMLPHIGLNATFAKPLAFPGNIGFISQSGALCTAILDWSLSNNVGFSAFISVGSMLDVNWGDLIYHLGDDPHTRSILLYMESVGDARSFLSAAREVALTKPIIVIKVGRTEAAAKAAASHTGALTGSDEVLDAAFRRVGVLRVDTIAELFDIAELLGKQPRPAGPRLAIVTNGGGPACLRRMR